jgi:methionyl-tRNA formyltransferase
MKSKIVLWVADANNQKALACKIAKEMNVVGIVIDTKKSAASSNSVISLLKKVINKVRFRKIDEGWNNMQNYYKKHFNNWPDTKFLHVPSINSKQTLEFTKGLNPDLVVVSGTSLIKEPLVSLPFSKGIINLHTGLSPYVKGGPNCTNWCIANNEWSLIGNTIMWLSAGIDSGNIITSEKTDITQSKTLSDIHINVMEHAHDLYLRAIRYLVSQDPPYQSVPQKSLGKGSLFLSKMWTADKKKQLLKNLKNTRNLSLDESITTVPIP